MHLKVQGTRAALHPSEIVVVVSTLEGEEKLVVDRQSMTDDELEIGQPIEVEGSKVLVELPRETYSGAWRVWVDSQMLVNNAA